MPKLERVREPWSGPLTPEDLSRKAAAGWALAAVEWTRPAEGAGQDAGLEEVPYGLQIADDGMHLRENPGEKQVLLVLMEWIAQDGRLAHIAQDLNQRGFRTRRGTPWGPETVFELLPRLIEAGPRLLSSREWTQRNPRPRLVPRQSAGTSR